MPDVRLDAVTDAIDDLQTDWVALVIAAKAASDPRAAVDLLDTGVVDMQTQVASISAAIFQLPTEEIAIDLHSTS